MWADEIRARLDSIRRNRSSLDEEETLIKLRCNHTYRNGESAMKMVYDTEGAYAFSEQCEVCGKSQ